MQSGGRSFVDHLLAAKNTIAGTAVTKVICKATTEELMGPKAKHIDFLLQATHQPDVSIPDSADILIERSQNSSWVVAFKSLITIHHLMSYGNERFEAYMASYTHSLEPMMVVDRMKMPNADMFVYIRQYASYLNEKREAYKLMGCDFCKLKRSKNDDSIRTMSLDKLYKALPVILKQIDSILLFEITANQLVNGIIHSCFDILIRDLIYLYAAFSDGIINILEKYFSMNKKQCRESLDIYKQYLDRTEKISQFLKIFERYEQSFNRSFWDEVSVFDRHEITDLIAGVEKNKASKNALESLENYLAVLEGKKTAPKLNQNEQDDKSVSVASVVNISDNSQKPLQDQAAVLPSLNQNKEAVSQPSIIDQQLFTDDLFSLNSPVSNEAVRQNVFDAPSPNSLSEILLPNPAATNKNPANVSPILFNDRNASLPTKPLQSGNLDSSLNQLVDNLNVHDHTQIGKDYDWTGSEAKNRHPIGQNSGFTSKPETTWPPFSPTIGPSAKSNAIWSQPKSTTNNPFDSPFGPSQTDVSNASYQPTNISKNPFDDQSFFNEPPTNQQQTNNPFFDL